jgi:hypothetical protein
VVSGSESDRISITSRPGAGAKGRVNGIVLEFDTCGKRNGRLGSRIGHVVQKITKLGRVNLVVGDETVWVVDDVARIKDLERRHVPSFEMPSRLPAAGYQSVFGRLECASKPLRRVSGAEGAAAGDSCGWGDGGRGREAGQIFDCLVNIVQLQDLRSMIGGCIFDTPPSVGSVSNLRGVSDLI